MNKNFVVPLLSLLVSVVIWGYNFVATKILLGAFTPYVLAFYSTFGATIILFLLFKKGLFQYSNAILIQTFFASFFGIFLFNVLVNYGMTKISPIDASLIIALVPLVSNIVDYIWLKNKLQAINIFATLLSISGVILLVTNGEFDINHFNKEALQGYLIMTLAVFSFVMYITLGKQVMTSMKPTHYTTWCFIYGSMLLILPASFFGGLAPYKSLNSEHLLYLSFAIIFTGIIANSAYNYGMEKTNIIIASLFSNSIPIFTMLFSYLVFNEQITTVKLLAAILVISGLVLPTVKRKK
jgi:drug/metabolite transporter (DMT)-like permease